MNFKVFNVILVVLNVNYGLFLCFSNSEVQYHGNMNFPCKR